MTEAVFRWLQPIAVKAAGVPNAAPDLVRPVLAVTEAGRQDPWAVRLVFLIADDDGKLVAVDSDKCQVGGVGSWSQLQMLQQRAAQISPVQLTPAQLRPAQANPRR